MVDIIGDNGLISRYAHLIDDSIRVSDGDHVFTGQIIGEVGNTGLVAGNACPDHPGTHLHFAMYQKQVDGTLTPYKPEPISGYTDLAEGNWYVSDNELYRPAVYAATDNGGGATATLGNATAPVASQPAASGDSAVPATADSSASPANGSTASGKSFFGVVVAGIVNVFDSASALANSFADKLLTLLGPAQTNIYSADDAANGAPAATSSSENSDAINGSADNQSTGSQTDVSANDDSARDDATSVIANITTPASARDAMSNDNSSSAPSRAPAKITTTAAPLPYAIGITLASGGVGEIQTAPAENAVAASTETLSPATSRDENTTSTDSAGSAQAEATSTSTATSTATATVITSLPQIENFTSAFEPQTLSFDFSWDVLEAATGASSTIFYALGDITNPESPLNIINTTSTQFSLAAADFAKEYAFSLQTFVGDGSAAAAWGDAAPATSTSASSTTDNLASSTNSGNAESQPQADSTSTLAVSSGPNGSAQAVSAISTTTVSAADYFFPTQDDDGAESNSSWYNDNWYNLGAGFSGTVYAMILRGRINDTDPANRSSQVNLSEYLDSGYSKFQKRFAVAMDAPFAAATSEVVLSGLNIPLQPNKYYRLETVNGRQNVSVVLQGTSATGTMMWNEFVSGTGRVEHTDAFYPYLALIMKKDFPPQSAPSAPQNLSLAFDPMNYDLSISWASSTDPDTDDNLLTYEVNIVRSTATSSPLALNPPNPAIEFSESGWTSMVGFSTSIKVVFPESDVIGVRAVDDFGNTSEPITANWSFPAGFYPLPEQTISNIKVVGSGPRKQKFLLNASATVSGIELTAAAASGPYCCGSTYLNIYTDDNGVTGESIATSTDVTLRQGDSPTRILYEFSEPIELGAGYFWIVPRGVPGALSNGIDLFGSSGNQYADGFWTDNSYADEGQDLYFRLRPVF